MTVDARRQVVLRPVFRKLRVFAVDPGLTARFETTVPNEMTLAIPWEDLEPGPAGEYVVVVDQDERGRKLFPPVDLDRRELLAQNGLAPSDGNPQFHQQMAYAVAMRTIHNFERALGRLIHWRQPDASAGDAAADHGGRAGSERYVRHLAIYPHAMEEPNAYYSPFQRRGFMFGYFASAPDALLPNTYVFTCLSQDVIAHEVTHAIFMGMNVDINFDQPGQDELAFYEAFADLIALFQHFWESDVLRAQIMEVRGNLDERSPLGAVALQFGQALGQPDGLRNALGVTDQSGMWRPRRPNPQLYGTQLEPHVRGDILVGAVFDAFRKIYESRVADLRRIATKGTGTLPQGSLHPDLVNRLTHEAAKSAQHVRQMCIRALDYLPAVDITFGDFLRAIITADYDYEARDAHRYRVAFVESFRRSGIFPRGVGTLSVGTLLWQPAATKKDAAVVADFVRGLSREHEHWSLPRDRARLWELLERWKEGLADHLRSRPAQEVKRVTGIDMARPFEVLAFHPRERASAGRAATQWVIKLAQPAPTGPARIGCTLLVDADTGLVRYRIRSARPRGRVGHRAGRAEEVDLRQLAGAARTPKPRERVLRVFAFDPSLGMQVETAGINEVTLRVPWERDAAGGELLSEGPVGEYLEVVDHDPASGCFYAPVDLNERHLLAQDGLPPSESNPQFHQQMVYAVAMRTIRTFERALGRLALWAPRPFGGRTAAPDEAAAEPAAEARVGARGGKRGDEFVQRLRLYPHALREANAYYSPTKNAVLFGYFPAPTAGGSAGAGSPRITVFTCLSHDIIAHEVTHALLDGMHRRFREPSNPDVLAFHEAFADLVALFQHFSLPDVLRHQIAATRGDLASQSRLGELAQQVGQAIGKRGALRSAIGEVDEVTKQWRPLEPDPDTYGLVMEEHARGAILVAAVFDAFLTIYKSRVADLLRLASEGTGVLEEGQLHPDLVNRLSDEAARAAQHVLDMCIKALDYCPPVDITFGDYLRAIVTADFEFDPVDAGHRRVAFVEAFRRRGIVPADVRTLSVDGLLWRPSVEAPDEDEDVVLDVVRAWSAHMTLWDLTKNRRDLHCFMEKKRAALQRYLHNKLKRGTAALGGIDPSLPLEVHSMRPSIRMDWQERVRFQWVIELTQRVPQYVGLVPGARPPEGVQPDYYFRGGCTLLVDAETGKVRYSIKKPLDERRRERQRRYHLEEAYETPAATYFGSAADEWDEPFAMLHRF